MKPRLLVILGVAALLLVFVMPPVGLVLGIITVVLSVRGMKTTRPQQQELLTPDGTPVTVPVAQPGRKATIVALVLSITATVMGALLFVVLIVFWQQVNDFADCESQTNTTQGLDKCQQQLKDAVFDRLGQ